MNMLHKKHELYLLLLVAVAAFLNQLYQGDQTLVPFLQIMHFYMPKSGRNQNSLHGFSIQILMLCIFTSAAQTFAEASLCGRALCFRAGVGAVVCVEEDVAIASVCVCRCHQLFCFIIGGGH